MGSDDLFKKRKGSRKARKENIRQMAPYRYLIVCEGEKTEPNYFEGIKKRINSKYDGTITLELEIKGTGRNTNSLVDFTATIEKIEKIRSQVNAPYGHIWVIFDKDDFSDDQFNSAIQQAKSKKYNAGWSNEAIELWFLLHFEFLNSGITRQQYIIKLNKYFKDNNINNGKYEKKLENIFEILSEYGDLDIAINYAKKLLEKHQDEGITSDAKRNPATVVFELIEELKEYF